jgi:hypothetical protein
MKKTILYLIFCFVILSCSNKKGIEKISDSTWFEPVDAHAFVSLDVDSIQKTIVFEMDGIKYSVFLWYSNENKIEPIIINVNGTYIDKKEGDLFENYYFWMGLEDGGERYFKNEILHRNKGFYSLYDIKNKSLKYTSQPSQDNRQDNFYVVTDENNNEIFIDKEWELEDDWTIEYGK